MSLRAITRPWADPSQSGSSSRHLLPSSKNQKIKGLSGTSNSGNRRLSSGGDQFVADLPVNYLRQKFLARRSLSVTQALVRVDQTGESSGSSSCFSQVQVFCSSESFRTITIKMDKLSYLAIPSEGGGGGGNSIVFSVQKGKCYPSRFQTTGNKNRLERVTCEANFVAVKIYLTICLGFTL